MIKLNKNQKIGLFVILVIGALFITINFLKGSNIFNKKTQLYSYFETVEGIDASGPVYIRGLKVGKIERVRYLQKRDIFEVLFYVQSKYEIPLDSESELYSSDILGGKSIRVNLGNSSLLAKSGDTLRSINTPDLISTLTNEIVPLKSSLELLMNNLNSAVSNLNDILNEENKENINHTLEDLKTSMEHIKIISKTLEASSPDIQGSLSNIHTLTSNFTQWIDSLSVTISNLNNFTGRLSEADIEKTISELNTLITSLNNPEGSFGKLTHTDSLHNAIKNLVSDIDSLVKNIEKNPKKFLKISVF